MATKLKAVYLGNEDGEYRGFTVGNEYEVGNYIAENDCFGSFDDDGCYLYINNGAFHKFRIHDENGYLNLKTQDEFISKEKQLKYYINGDAVTKCKFNDVLLCVMGFQSDWIDASSIKFEVKFE